MEFTVEFLKGLWLKLDEYCFGKFDTKDWVDMQELATQGGYKVFEDYCQDTNNVPLLKRVELLDYEGFDDFIYELSKQLIAHNI